MRRVVAVSAVVAALYGCGDDEKTDAGAPATPRFSPAADTARVDHPLVPLESVRLKVFEGSEKDADTGEIVATRVVQRTLERTVTIEGVRNAVVEVKEYEDGDLVEHTFDYYAQAKDGGVWYFGEKVDDIEDGRVTGHGGQWQAGRKGAEAGLFMPARPSVGDTFEQERAPGVAEDRSTVLSVGGTVRVPAGTFENCIRTRDVAPLSRTTEFKQYCEDVGLVSEGTNSRLVRYER